jgi:hypothetical protein
VQQLLRRVLDWLPVGQRSMVTLNRQRLRVDLRRRDDDFVPATVQAAVEKAYDERRRLRFWYRRPARPTARRGATRSSRGFCTSTRCAAISIWTPTGCT